MLKPFARWTVVLAVLVVVGPLVGGLVGGLHQADGQVAATPMLADSTPQGLLAGLALMAAAAIAGFAGSRFSQGTGLACAGLVVAWGAWNSATALDALREAQPGTLIRLAIEAWVFGVLAVGLSVVLLGWGQPSHMTPGDVVMNAPTRGRGLRRGLVSPMTWAAAGVGAAAAGGVVWIIAFDLLKGQAVFAAFCGGIAAGAATRLVLIAAWSGRDHEPSWGTEHAGIDVSPFLSMFMVAVAAPFVASVMHEPATIPEAVRAPGGLFALARVMPLDYLAGMFLGIPVGVGWAVGMMERRLHSSTVQPAVASSKPA